MGNLFTRILVGVDDSAPSRDAIGLAARLAREHGGTLVLCNSVDWIPLVSQTEAYGTFFDPTPIIDGLKAQGKALLNEAAQTAKSVGIEPQLRSSEGPPAENLLRAATDAGCTLIVMGTHGRRGLGRLVLGSTTEAVLRGSSMPVLTVRSGERVAALPRRCFERIVVGIDDSEPSDAALQTTLDLPEADRRAILLCSVLDSERYVGAYGYLYGEMVASLREQTQTTLDRALDVARAHHVAAAGHLLEGSTSVALMDIAKREQADLIVVGSHGRRGLQRFFLGSAAESIVRSATMPVLVVRTA